MADAQSGCVAPEFASLLGSLPRHRQGQLRLAGRVARRLRMPVYLIGGSVRDLLLGRPSPDLDLCVVGDGIAFARALARELGAPRAVETRFLTSKIASSAGTIDVATARRETYPRPGALPRVSPGDIDGDLARRDFTINAMALRLDRRRRELLDPLGGGRDLSRRQLRMLHARSFVDDPTRLLRAARYAARLGFHLERRTLRLAREAVAAGVMDRVSGERLRRELLLLLEEPRASAGWRLCGKLGVSQALHPGLAVEADTPAALCRSGEICERFSRCRPGANPDCALARLLVLARSLSPAEGCALSERLRLTARHRQALSAYLERQGRARRALAAARLRNSALARALEGLPLEAVVALAATSSPRARRRCELFLTHLREMKALLRGEDLLAQGFAPHPAWGRALAAARDARRDRRARSKNEELRIAAAVLRAHGVRSSRRADDRGQGG
ncbi:MAG TPA: hypothetical protein VM221_11730 [Armatimonadota bacterium]|nr:hypothetical protein [Armatimonadota bacterium]